MHNNNVVLFWKFTKSILNTSVIRDKSSTFVRHFFSLKGSNSDDLNNFTVNLALRKPAYEENIYRHANVSAGNAVDGRKSNLKGLGGECSISAEKQRTATWWVNLESIYSIHNIRIYYRTENLAWGTYQYISNIFNIVINLK